MNAAEYQDAGRTVTRRRHVIVARQRPASPEAPSAAPATSATMAPTPATIGDTRVMTSEQLFAGQSAVAIQHNGAMYTLRVTRFGKLILTK
ncbi:hemin uptake protein HemP [Ralstonia soli]|uniref:Hemin uptake protein HemP n=1 Tax=Ralstonia soli TaxID=2953896 RepID=A0ABT1ARN1_9RALS|nr:hemin uptake protein HemP [Ralstonia soli]MCO5401123.1 hemin uptake protein HemP [Ralstonia soli]